MKYISVNPQVIRKRGDKPIRIARTPSDSRPQYANHVNIIGPAEIFYEPSAAVLKCGARVVIRCKDVEIVS